MEIDYKTWFYLTYNYSFSQSIFHNIYSEAVGGRAKNAAWQMGTVWMEVMWVWKRKERSFRESLFHSPNYERARVKEMGANEGKLSPFFIAKVRLIYDYLGGKIVKKTNLVSDFLSTRWNGMKCHGRGKSIWKVCENFWSLKIIHFQVEFFLSILSF